MRDQQDDQQQSPDRTRAPQSQPKDGENRGVRYDLRNEGDADNPLICRGID